MEENQQQNQEQKQNEPENKEHDNTKKYTDKDIDDIINSKFAKWESQKAKEISEAQKLAQMDAQQKAEFERDKLQVELDKLKQSNSLNDMKNQTRKMLSDSKVNVTDEILNVLVTSDAEKTKTAVDSFITVFKASVENAVKEALRGETPKTGEKAKLTKQQILSITDAVERRKAIKENIDLFN